MALPWVRLDTQFPSNPKVLELVEGKKYRAIAVYTCSLAYAGAHGTDGFIPKAALPFIHSTAKEAQELVSVGLWHTDKRGWLINDWADYQQTSEATADLMHAKRSGARKGNCIRWHGQNCGCWQRPPDDVAPVSVLRISDASR